MEGQQQIAWMLGLLHGVPDSWFQLGPDVAVVANLGVDQQMKDVFVCLSLSLSICLLNK